MKRKKFIKLLMGQGVQRNEANVIALLVQYQATKFSKKEGEKK